MRHGERGLVVVVREMVERDVQTECNSPVANHPASMAGNRPRGETQTPSQDRHRLDQGVLVLFELSATMMTMTHLERCRTR